VHIMPAFINRCPTKQSYTRGFHGMSNAEGHSYLEP
jgi:hypothetical protein